MEANSTPFHILRRGHLQHGQLMDLALYKYLYYRTHSESIKTFYGSENVHWLRRLKHKLPAGVLWPFTNGNVGAEMEIYDKGCERFIKLHYKVSVKKLR